MKTANFTTADGVSCFSFGKPHLGSARRAMEALDSGAKGGQTTLTGLEDALLDVITDAVGRVTPFARSFLMDTLDHDDLIAFYGAIVRLINGVDSGQGEKSPGEAPSP